MYVRNVLSICSDVHNVHMTNHPVYVLMIQLPGSIGFPTPLSSMSRTECLNNEAPVAIFLLNYVD